MEKGEAEKAQKMYDDGGRSFKAQISRNFWGQKEESEIFCSVSPCVGCVIAAVFIIFF